MSYVGNSLTSHDSSLYNAQVLERMTYGCGLMRKHMEHIYIYRGADKSLARPGRKQARKYFRNARDFNNIETRAVIKFFFFLQGKAPKEIHAILTETLASFLPGRAKDLSAPLYIYKTAQAYYRRGLPFICTRNWDSAVHSAWDKNIFRMTTFVRTS